MIRRIVFMVLALVCGLTLSARRPKTVRLETTEGVIRIALSDRTPQHRDNFIKLVREGYFDGLLFHRVIRDFMIQGGDPDSRMKPQGHPEDAKAFPPHDKPLGNGGPGYTLPSEIDFPALYHRRGAVAAAREGDAFNPERRSSGSQFYIVYGERWSKERLAQQGFGANRRMRRTYRKQGGTPWLDGAYSVFGQVVSGMEVVERIQQYQGDKFARPLKDVVILRAVVED